MVEAKPKSYKERQREARAEARAKRQAEKEAWRRQIELRAVVRRLSLDAAKATIRDRGGKVTDYDPAQLRVIANAFIGPWLVVQAKANENLNIRATHKALRCKHFQRTKLMLRMEQRNDQGLRTSEYRLPRPRYSIRATQGGWSDAAVQREAIRHQD
jgi:hypothetical protein